MDIKPIKTEADYRNSLREIEGLMMAAPGSPEGDRLDVLVTLVEAYERKQYPIESPDPIEAIKFRMEQQGLTVDALVPAIGKKNRVYEVLAYRRPLTLRMIRALNRIFKIPAESLIGEAPARRSA